MRCRSRSARSRRSCGSASARGTPASSASPAHRTRSPRTCGPTATSASCSAAVAAVDDAFGGVDVLVNNAFDDGDHRLVTKASFDDWRRTMDTNLYGTLELTRAVVPSMTARGGGHVVMVNSMSSVRIE